MSGKTYVDVPNALVNIVRAWATARLTGITADGIVPFLCLQMPYTAGKETSRDQIQDTGRGHQEYLQLGS